MLRLSLLIALSLFSSSALPKVDGPRIVVHVETSHLTLVIQCGKVTSASSIVNNKHYKLYNKQQVERFITYADMIFKHHYDCEGNFIKLEVKEY